MFGSAASSRYATAAISPAWTLRHVVPRNSDSDCIYRIVVVNMLHIRLLMLLLQTVVSYKSFCRYKTRLIIGLNCHILCEATLLLGTGDTEAVRNVGGGAADTLDRDCSRQHQPLGLGSASIHLTSGGGATILHTQSGQCSGFILGAVRCSRYVFCHTVPRCCMLQSATAALQLARCQSNHEPGAACRV